REGVKTIYRGGAIIQNAPLFTAIGNHEVMGRFSMETDLNAQYNDPFPKTAAVQQHPQQAKQLSADSAALQSWLNQNSYSTETYEELFTLPESASGGKKYYAQTFGKVRLVVLFVANIWRTPSLTSDARGRYRERDADLENPERWGYGQHIFEAIAKGSTQYTWLQQELNSPEFQQAQYKIVMFHHPMHSLGDNIVPAYTNPVQSVDSDDSGKVNAIRYEYPLSQDYLIRDVEPLLEAAGVDLVFYGHSHLWNRFISPGGIHFLESSNIGNSYGAYLGNTRRPIPVGFVEKYAAVGDPNGLEPITPEIAPLIDDQGQPQPYIASNDMTVFSILDTGRGVVSSYRFDTRKPDSAVIKFDEFKLGG
ncbi:MAG: metallophosphoesterase, partial [Thermosynechococcaceae cyanobacterium MS004]|nr:metallophosphoesterase [Thermosynechococcaceae cyanobacterium MS004]